jgi:hypothetical protein
MWPHVCSRHENFFALSMPARALLLEFVGQYRGHNNGDLTCAWKVLRKRGWRSRTTIEKARLELERSGWIVRTRQGFRNRCSLYALTFFAIDECDGKHERAPTRAPLGYWRLGQNPDFEESQFERPPPKAFSKSSSGATAPKTSTETGQVANAHPADS